MIQNFKENWALSILTFFMFAVALSEIAIVFDVDNTSIIWLFVGGLSLVVSLIPYFFLRLVVYIPIYFMTLYSLSFSGYIYTFSYFLTDWIRNLLAFILEGNSDHYSLAIMSIMLFVIILLLEWQVTTDTITPQMLFFVGYLLLLNEFNELSVTVPIVIIVSIYLLERVVVHSEVKINAIMLLTVCTALFIAIASIYIQYTPIKSALITASTPLRQELDKRGVYEFINEHKFRFMARTGFGEDDSQLGGPVKDDDSLVFDVKQKTPRYWRVESKMEYTGKGWVNNDSGILETRELTQSLSINPEGYQNDYKEPEDLTLHFYYENTYLPISYGKVYLPANQGNIFYQYNERTDRVNLNQNPGSQDIIMSIESPDYEEETLQKAKLVVPDEQYIQLPESIPKSIEELTREITDDKETLYDKVKAVESYLKISSQYRYSKSGTRHVPANSDYVEFFLFESKVGYCDNFSSAMSVMLRSIGIPTRWVKGFSQGQVRETQEDYSIYNIRNSDAHSWVEVYFEGSDWVPFEPTPSFTGTQQVQEQKKEEKTTPSSSDKKDNNTQQSSSQSERNAARNQQDDRESILEKISLFFDDNKKVVKLVSQIVGLILLMIIVLIAFRYRYFMGLLISIGLLKRPFTRIYRLLLKQIEEKVARENSETLNAYAEKVAEEIPDIGTPFSELTREYEAVTYGVREDVTVSESQKNKILNLSKYLIKKRGTLK